ncbi:MAG TPA: hydroxymethylbilane synthase [Gemmatimonadales bacterium]|nr:hydroxymethylbilane synthase [Gemmatimonadales bacterium]
MSPRYAPLRIGTRSSALALWQTERVRTLLASGGHRTERIEIKTTGDLTPDVPLARIGSRALFTKQIDDALLECRIDLAVHSLKDLPTQLPEGITVAAVSVREDPRDALVGRGPLHWRDLPPGATIATSSLRRRAQLLSARGDLRVVDIRGNVDTRLAKLDAREDWNAIVLAAAGLIRLGAAGRIGERLPPEIMLPAPGQGALAVTARTADAELHGLIRRAVHDPETSVSVAAERAFLRRLEGGCQVPIAAYARRHRHGSGPTMLRLDGRVIALSGRSVAEGTEEAVFQDDEAHASDMGTMLAERLLENGAAAILSEVRAGAAPVVTEP